MTFVPGGPLVGVKLLSVGGAGLDTVILDSDVSLLTSVHVTLTSPALVMKQTLNVALQLASVGTVVEPRKLGPGRMTGKGSKNCRRKVELGVESMNPSTHTIPPTT